MRTAWWDKIQPVGKPTELGVDPSHSDGHATLAIVLGGLIAGICDLTFAITFHAAAHGVKPIRVAQSIASGLLGASSYRGEWASATLGVVLHFLIALSAAAIYYLASRRLKFLLSWAPICGALYGAAIFFFMRWVVLPLSAVPRFKSTAVGSWSDFAVHVFLIGLPIALVARHYGSPMRPVSGDPTS